MAPSNSAIKLLEVKSVGNIRRFQSQLYVGKDSADFIMEEGILKCYEWNTEKGFGFFEFHKPYEIVSSVEEMFKQTL